MEDSKPLIPVPLAVGGMVVLLGAAAFWAYDDYARKHPPPAPTLTAEAKAYVSNLRLSEVSMQAAESYLKQAVVEIEGKIANNGDRVIRLAEINCVFYDAYGQLVLRERVPIVGRRMGSLAQGEIKNFHMAFDNIPPSWNQQMPQLVIARILFE